MRAAIATLIVAPLALAAVPAAAQSNPSSDQIIQSLKPSGNLLGGGTRGIRMVNPNATADTPQATGSAATPSSHGAAAPHPARTATAAAAGTSSATAPSVSLSVLFATGSAELTPQARQTLDQLGTALSSSDLAQYRFRIEGHTDTVGSADLNKELSQKRAEAVAAYLEQKFGMKTDRLEPIGMGEDGLAIPTPPNTPNEKNRRVKVINLGA
jgi:OmpA-OmpF porin, OOP family